MSRWDRAAEALEMNEEARSESAFAASVSCCCAERLGPGEGAALEAPGEVVGASVCWLLRERLPEPAPVPEPEFDEERRSSPSWSPARTLKVIGATQALGKEISVEGAPTTWSVGTTPRCHAKKAGIPGLCDHQEGE